MLICQICVMDETSAEQNHCNSVHNESGNENSTIFREYPISVDILSKIPLTEITQFFKTRQIAITCFDAVNHRLLFGTNIGCSYLYNPEKDDIIKIIGKKKEEIVTAVKLYSGIENQIAIATYCGSLKIISSSDQIKKFELGNVHECQITCLHWSLNGMHLFSGDKTGNVYDTIIDFEQDSCNVSFVKNFGFEVVQLEYRHKVLLVSTVEKSVLVRCDDNNMEIQLGSKPSRFGPYGACFNCDTIVADDLEIFATRPGCRLWRVSTAGNVTSTLLLKEQASDKSNNILMLDECKSSTHSEYEIQFGKIVVYKSNVMVTFRERRLFLIDVDKQCILYGHEHECDIVDICVTGEEVFILCKNRRLHRISYSDEIYMKAQSSSLSSTTDRNLQNVKDTFEEVKQNISPLVGSIQLGFSSFNDSAGKFSNKLQQKAKIFQNKLSVIKIGTSHTEEVNMTDINTKNTDSEPTQSDIKNEELSKSSNEMTYTEESLHSQIIGKGNDTATNHQTNEENAYFVETQDRFPSLNVSPPNEIVHKTVRRKRTKTNSRISSNTSTKSEDEKLTIENEITNISNEIPELKIDDILLKEDETNEIIPISFHVNDLPLILNQSDLEVNVEDDSDKSISPEVVEKNTPSEDSAINCPHGVEEVVVSVQKSSGNKILPEIILSPTKHRSEFNFDFDDQPQCTKCSPPSPIFKNNFPHKIFPANDDNSSLFSKENEDEELESSLEDVNETDESQMIDIYANAKSEEDHSMKETIFVQKNIRDPLFSDSSSEDNEEILENDFRNFQDVTTEISMRVSDTWRFLTTSHDAVFFGGGSNLVWFIDSWNRIYITEDSMFQDDSKTVWKRLAKKGKQFALSPSGDLAAIISPSGKLYTASVIHDFMKESEIVNLDWYHMESGVNFVTFEINYLIAISTHGICRIKHGLSRASPNGRKWTDLFVPEKVHEIAVVNCGVIWVTTLTGNILASGDIGATWDKVPQPHSSYATNAVIQHISSDGVDVMFACDNIGCFWFRTGINNKSPAGFNWWQVIVTQYMGNDHNYLPFNIAPAVTHTINKVNHAIISKVRIQQFAVTHTSMWLLTDKRRMHIARGQVTGNYWKLVRLLGIAESASSWQHITTSSIFLSENNEWTNLIWVSRSINNEIFCFNTDTYETSYPVALPPLAHVKESIIKISACRTALWVLLADGNLVVRSGITSSCLQGTKWSNVDVESQLEQTHIVDVACCNHNVWAVSNTGRVYFRSGVESHNQDELSPAWLFIDACPNENAFFTKISCSPSDMQVYAIDNNGSVYARSGLSLDFPIGTSWEEMPGADAVKICASNHSMYVLRKSGNILQRSGISSKNCAGDYWKKFKTRFRQLAVTPSNELWSIDNSCKLHHLLTHSYCPNLLKAVHDTVQNTSRKVSNDWEII